MDMSQYLGKSKRPIISVVIPTYNEEKDIEDLLESLNKQTFKNFEVIIVDNYSKDKTIEIVKRFKRKLNLRI
jgi:glycosyltransferase involved in cell wall biosynthesis